MKKLQTLAIVFALTIITAITLTGCGGSSSASAGNTAAKEQAGSDQADKTGGDAEAKVVRMGCVGENNVLTDAMGIAQENGYLDEELEKVGYQLEVTGFAQAGPAINEAFVAGELDMAVYGDLPSLICKSNGGDTTVFGVENDQQQMCILAQKDSGIKSAKDLGGHKVIVAIGTIYQEYFKNIIKEAGVKESDIEQINTFSDATSIMSSKDADALITSTSIAKYLEGQGIGEVVQTSEKNVDQTAQFFIVGKTDYLKENPEAAKAVIKASIRGKEYLLEHKKECYETFAKRNGAYPKEVFEQIYAYDESFGYLDPVLDEDNNERFTSLVKFAKTEGLINQEVAPEDFIDPSYSQEAAKEYKEENK